MRDLAIKHRLRFRRDEDGTYIIPGRRGFIYRHSDSKLGWCLTFDYSKGEQPTSRLKEMAKKDPRLELLLEGDEEAIFTFDPEDLAHVARRWCQARKVRRLSDERREALVKAGEATRFEKARGQEA